MVLDDPRPFLLRIGFDFKRGFNDEMEFPLESGWPIEALIDSGNRVTLRHFTRGGFIRSHQSGTDLRSFLKEGLAEFSKQIVDRRDRYAHQVDRDRISIYKLREVL